MFNIAQLVARCDFLLLKQATLLPPATAGHKSTASYCRQQVACLDGALVSYHIILCILAIGRRIHGSRDGVYKNKANDLEWTKKIFKHNVYRIKKFRISRVNVNMWGSTE